MMTVSWNFLF